MVDQLRSTVCERCTTWRIEEPRATPERGGHVSPGVRGRRVCEGLRHSAGAFERVRRAVSRMVALRPHGLSQTTPRPGPAAKSSTGVVLFRSRTQPPDQSRQVREEAGAHPWVIPTFDGGRERFDAQGKRSLARRDGRACVRPDTKQALADPSPSPTVGRLFHRRTDADVRL